MLLLGLPQPVLRLVAYRDDEGREPFHLWFDELDRHAGAKVAVALTRLGQGNLSQVKSVGTGVFERRIAWGPGYRVYFGRDGERLVILLGGGTKVRQQTDIVETCARWIDYKTRRRA